jgi:hypothetical protein
MYNEIYLIKYSFCLLKLLSALSIHHSLSFTYQPLPFPECQIVGILSMQSFQSDFFHSVIYIYVSSMSSYILR